MKLQILSVRHGFVAALLVTATLLLPPVAAATPGDPDTSFNATGFARHGLGHAWNSAEAVVAQPDLKYIVAGSCENGFSADFSLVRYNFDGSIDTTFGAGGRVETDVAGGSEDLATGVALQQDGRILVAGQANGRAVVARYRADGSLDPTFGDGGLAVFGDPSSSNTNAITLQPDGKIVVAGVMYLGPSSHVFIARLTADGILDPLFGNGGLTQSVILARSRADGIVYQADGKLVVVGDAIDNLAVQVMLVARYTSSGVLDWTFNSGGVVAIPVGSSPRSYAVTMQSSLTNEDKIVVAGDAFISSWDFVVVRLNLDGSLDTTFDDDGLVTTDFLGGGDGATAVAIQYSGATPTRIIVTGTAYNTANSDTDFGVARYLLNGAPDQTFDGDGKLVAPLGTGGVPWSRNDVATAMVRTVGRILVVGSTSEGDYTNLGAIRWHDNGVLDTGFDGDGKRIDDIGGWNSECAAVAIQPDGPIIMGGWSVDPQIPYSQVFAVLRCLPDGSPDPAFGDFGRVLGPSGVGSSAIQATAVQTDGKILAAGYAGASVLLARYNTDGTLDESLFGNPASTDLGPGSDLAVDMAVQPDGKILLACQTRQGSTEMMAVIRFNANGVIDLGFGNNGVTIVAVGSNAYAVAIGLAPDGRIYVGGHCLNGPDYDFALVRLNTNGLLDTGFGANGRAIAGVGVGDDNAAELVVQPDGKIILAGASTDGTTAELALLRFEANGALDPTFGDGGRVRTPLPMSLGIVGLALQADGTIMTAAGRYNPSGDQEFLLACYLQQGALNPTWGAGGIQTVEPNIPTMMARDLALDAAGRLVVGGGSGDLMAIARFLGGAAPAGVADDTRPVKGWLGAPYPNPTRGLVVATLKIVDSAPVHAVIVDVSGRLVRTLLEGEALSAGERVLGWDGRTSDDMLAPNGVYYLRVRQGSGPIEARKITLLHEDGQP